MGRNRTWVFLCTIVAYNYCNSQQFPFSNWRDADKPFVTELRNPDYSPEKYSENPDTYSGLWRMPFGWMLDEAKNAGLLVDEQRFQTVLRKTPAITATMDSSTTRIAARNIVAAGKVFSEACLAVRLEVPGSNDRTVQVSLDSHGALIHWSTLLRIRDKMDYAPPNFSSGFLEKVSGLQEVPETIPYEKETIK